MSSSGPESSKRSLIAGVNALMRSQESMLPPSQAVLQDAWADRLGETHAVVRWLQWARGWLPPLQRNLDELVTAHVVRHRSVDALVQRALGLGCAQVVILGAGYDMRCLRIGPDFPEVQWFELDRPAVLSRKEQLLAADARSGQVRRVPLEIGGAPMLQVLTEAGWRADRATLFVAEGLIHYLPLPQVRALLADVGAGAAPRALALSYITPAMVTRASSTFRNLVRLVREIPDTFFTHEQLDAELRAVGLSGLQSWEFQDQLREFAPQAQGRPIGVSQEVGWVSRGLT